MTHSTCRKLEEKVEPGYLRRAAAAKYLSISVRTLCGLQAKRMVAFSKLGAKTCLFKISDLDALVTGRRQNSIGGKV